ncbi:MAG: 3-deoxy-8-phosphooctulonate synthase [Chloroherpetonaceae bacterium]|nr:3-deoxy-8-phosphooctulonate synthase [Chloroherpetonaceae bacterium]
MTEQQRHKTKERKSFQTERSEVRNLWCAVGLKFLALLEMTEHKRHKTKERKSFRTEQSGVRNLWCAVGLRFLALLEMTEHKRHKTKERKSFRTERSGVRNLRCAENQRFLAALEMTIKHVIKPMKKIQITNDCAIETGGPLVIIAGPCVIESEEHAMKMAESLLAITKPLGVQLIYKSSFDKANRTSIKGFRGGGMEEGLAILRKVKETFHIPVLTDIHESYQAEPAAEVVDVLQIPAFLCRQTDLLIAAGKTGKVVNVKKGQFLAPWDMKNIVTKLESTGNENILLTERGTSFGYNNLVVDFRSIPEMQKFGYPVVFDATHSVQMPGGLGERTGGERKYAPLLAKAALAVGADALFMEVHDNPDAAPSDGPNMIELRYFKDILISLKTIFLISKN